MKKLMNKKMSFLGKEFTVLALVMVMMMTFASAALVTYLSDPVADTFTTASPLALGDDGAFIDLDSIYGGETATIDIPVSNNANVPIVANLQVNISNDKIGADCDDFVATITSTDSSLPAGLVCSDDNAGLVQFVIPTSLDADTGTTPSLETYTIALEFNVAVEPATYTVDAIMTPTA